MAGTVRALQLDALQLDYTGTEPFYKRSAGQESWFMKYSRESWGSVPTGRSRTPACREMRADSISTWSMWGKFPPAAPRAARSFSRRHLRPRSGITMTYSESPHTSMCISPREHARTAVHPSSLNFPGHANGHCFTGTDHRPSRIPRPDDASGDHRKRWRGRSLIYSRSPSFRVRAGSNPDRAELFTCHHQTT